MNHNADAFFAIGKTHMVCEDYARAGFTENGHPYAIVCDGCSSSPDTDTGARALALAAQQDTKWLCLDDSLSQRQRLTITDAALSLKSMRVDPRAADATLVMAYWNGNDQRDGDVIVEMRGDGVVAARRQDGSFVIDVVDHVENAPHYLNYMMDEQREAGYREKFGFDFTIKNYDSRTGWAPTMPYSPTPNPELSLVSRPFLAESGHPDAWLFMAEEFDLVVVMSDGVQSFQRCVQTNTSKTLEPIPIEDVIEQLLKIKGTKGEFLKRRCHKFLTKFCVKNNWQHSDDFSAAAIWMEDTDDA